MIARNHDSTLALQVLNALSQCIAVLDAAGTIAGVNEAWLRFGRENGATDPHGYVGANYLSVCEEALAREKDARLEEILRGLRAILDGKEQEFCVEYPCDSPAERRWFSLTGTSLRRSGELWAVLSHEDITLRKRVEESLRDTERMLRSVLDALPVGVWIVDRDGAIVQGNPMGISIWAGARYVGFERYGEYKGWWLSTGEPVEEWAAERAVRTGEASVNEEIVIQCFDRSRKIILNSAIPLRSEQGEVVGAIIVNQDITARKLDEAELRRTRDEIEATSRELADALARERMISRIDSLTGAMTRGHFFELAQQEVYVALRYQHPLSLILFDLDDFKLANDTLGHQAGDELLKLVALVARSHLRDADIFARYGGDEFVVLLPQTGAADAASVAERVRADVAAASINTPHGLARTTISCGIAEMHVASDTLEAMIQRADEALYEAKKQGRNRTAAAEV